MELVVLVDTEDQEVGVMEKIEAHERGELHRAFSVFLFNHEGQMLLQQRAFTKYHSGGLWTNACCSHPRPGEVVESAAKRRLQEELGISAEIDYRFNFLYKSDYENGLSEHEYDHVYFGSFSGPLTPNEEEVHAYKYVSIKDLENWVKAKPEDFTTWFRICLPKVLEHLD